MPTFRYITRDTAGLSQSGTLTASSMEMLTSELRRRGLLVLDVEVVDSASKKPAITANPLTWLPVVSFDVEMGFQQLASMLHSGLSLLSGLRTVAEQARRVRAAVVWHDVADRIEQGATFAGSLAAQ